MGNYGRQWMTQSYLNYRGLEYIKVCKKFAMRLQQEGSGWDGRMEAESLKDLLYLIAYETEMGVTHALDGYFAGLTEYEQQLGRRVVFDLKTSKFIQNLATFGEYMMMGGIKGVEKLLTARRFGFSVSEFRPSRDSNANPNRTIFKREQKGEATVIDALQRLVNGAKSRYRSNYANLPKMLPAFGTKQPVIELDAPINATATSEAPVVAPPVEEKKPSRFSRFLTRLFSFFRFSKKGDANGKTVLKPVDSGDINEFIEPLKCSFINHENMKALDASQGGMLTMTDVSSLRKSEMPYWIYTNGFLQFSDSADLYLSVDAEQIPITVQWNRNTRNGKPERWHLTNAPRIEMQSQPQSVLEYNDESGLTVGSERDSRGQLWNVDCIRI